MKLEKMQRVQSRNRFECREHPRGTSLNIVNKPRLQYRYKASLIESYHNFSDRKFKPYEDEIDHIKEMNALMPKKLDQIAQSPTLV